jgi:hypothetical protein
VLATSFKLSLEFLKVNVAVFHAIEPPAHDLVAVVAIVPLDVDDATADDAPRASAADLNEILSWVSGRS